MKTAIWTTLTAKKGLLLAGKPHEWILPIQTRRGVPYSDTKNTPFQWVVLFELIVRANIAPQSHYKSPDVPKGLPQTAGADESLALPNTTATSPSLTQILWRLERLERFRVEDAPLKQTMKHLKLRIDTLYEQNAHLKAKLRLIRTRVKRMANCIEDLEIRGVPRTRKRSRRSIQ